MTWNSFVSSIEGTWPPIQKPVLIKLYNGERHFAEFTISAMSGLPFFEIIVYGDYGKQSISIPSHDVSLWGQLPD